MQDAEVYYLRHVPLAQPPHNVMSELIDEVPWRAENIVVWGRTYPQPRLIAWYGDIGKNYTYSGINLSPVPWTQALMDIKSRVEGATRTDFNSVLLNLYRDGQDSVSWHADNEPGLGRNPVIASLSLGAMRRFQLKHRRLEERHAFDLPHGSCLIMAGATQHHWLHQLPKTRAPVGPRINLTFRKMG